MTTRVITQATSEPITRVQAKNYLRVDFTTDDSLIDDCITRARKMCEQTTGLALAPQTLLSIVETDSNIRGAFSGARTSVPFLYLPYSPVSSVTAISYETDRNIYTDTDVTNFSIDYESKPCNLVLNKGVELQAMPTQYGTYKFKVTYVAGFTSLYDIPANIITAMYMYVSMFYSNRDNEEMTCAAQCLLLREKIYLL